MLHAINGGDIPEGAPPCPLISCACRCTVHSEDDCPTCIAEGGICSWCLDDARNDRAYESFRDSRDD